MVIITGKGLRIKTTEQPRWDGYHKVWHVNGYRWISTRATWSANHLAHTFSSYRVEEGARRA